MTVLLVVATFVIFVLADLLVRTVTQRLEERRARRERAAALATAVRLDFTDEARTLKRVEVDGAKARVLAVDDEPVILDAMRKILVLDGFNVDTVESGPEALGLVQRHDYDFVFTDLKMPGMDGIEVVKGVKHLRPDVDVAVVTGFATIESAVETMRDGAVDYVQKPFTADELVAFARRLLLKRQARLEAQRRPRVRVVTPGLAETVGAGEFCVPGGAFLSDGHAWARIESSGQVRVGLDDFARQALGTIERVELPAEDTHVRRGDPLVTLQRGETTVRVAAPLSGRVAAVNPALLPNPEALGRSPYDDGWVCLLEADDLAAQLAALRIGVPVVDWYQAEIARLRALGGPADRGAPQVDWQTLQTEFFTPRPLPTK
jgi:CheY-like chemotaxis protein/glycine cleavage system H lipoate-binding protein